MKNVLSKSGLLMMLLFFASAFLVWGETGTPKEVDDLDQYQSREGERAKMAKEPESLGVIRRSLWEGGESIRSFFRRRFRWRPRPCTGMHRQRWTMLLRGTGDGLLGPFVLVKRACLQFRRLRTAGALDGLFLLLLPGGDTPAGAYTFAYALSCLLVAAAFIAIGSKRSRRAWSYVGFAHLVTLLIFFIVLILSIPEKPQISLWLMPDQANPDAADGVGGLLAFVGETA